MIRAFLTCGAIALGLPMLSAHAQPGCKPDVQLYYYDHTIKFGEDVVATLEQVKARNADGRCRVSRIEIIGHADSERPADVSQSLSLEMANSAQSELVKIGFPKALMRTRGVGEDDPAAPGPDGVREPLNRRVEVLFYYR